MRICVLLILGASAMLYGQKVRDNPSDWPMYTRDLAGTRYSPLKQINAGNVAKLTEAWNYQLRAAGPAGSGRGAAQGADQQPAAADPAAVGANADFAAAAAAPAGG